MKPRSATSLWSHPLAKSAGWSRPFSTATPSWSTGVYGDRNNAPASGGFETVNKYAPSQPARAITIADLTRYGPPPLLPDALVGSAELTRKELPHRLARRVRAHHGLPYLPASNPSLTKVMNIYQRGLQEIESFPPIKTLAENKVFVRKLEAMVDDAAEVIPMLAKGFQESRKYLLPAQTSAFLDRAIRNRIAIRLIAEQHIALTYETERLENQGVRSGDPRKGRGTIGIVDTRLEVRKAIEGVANYVSDLCEGTYGISPSWELEGDIDARVCFIGMHLEYIMTEILKNAFRATVEHHCSLEGSSTPKLPPVIITISSPHHPPAAPAPEAPSRPHHTFSPALFAPAPLRRPSDPHSTLTIRVRDNGGGIDPVHMEGVFSYAFTTAKTNDDEDPDAGGGMYETDAGGAGVLNASGLQTGLGTIAGLGYGLPMARTYARYLGGGLDLVSVHGVGGGVDAFVTLKLGRAVV